MPISAFAMLLLPLSTPLSFSPLMIRYFHAMLL